LPLLIPIPLPPGLTTIFAVPLIIFTIQMLGGKMDGIWLPKWIGNRSLKSKVLREILNKSIPIISFMEKILRPRIKFLINKLSIRILGIASLFFSILIAIPLPFTNLLPALAIFCIAIGILNQDGLIIIAGILIGIIGTIIVAFILIFGEEFIHKIAKYIKKKNT
jgi:hypothetical protein